MIFLNKCVFPSYTEQKQKRNTFVFAPIFHELIYTQWIYFSQILFTNLFKSELVYTYCVCRKSLRFFLSTHEKTGVKTKVLRLYFCSV